MTDVKGTGATGGARVPAAWSWALVSVVMILGLMVPVASEGQQVQLPSRTLSLGGYYSKGDYGSSQDTTIRYFPLRYQQQVGHWNYALIVPYLELEGLGNVLVNVGGVSRARVSYGLLDSSGLGDMLLSATYQADPLFGGTTFVDIGLEVKIPTADEKKGLGSGEYDYNLRADIYRSVGSFTLFGALGYRIRGESEIYPGLEDTAYLELGAQRPLGSGLTAGLLYSYSEPPAHYSRELHEVLPYLNWQLDENWSIDGYGAWGFTEDSPDMAIGMQINYRW